MESWLSKKPYWEQYLWANCYKYASLEPGAVEKCFELLAEHLGIGPAVTWEKPAIDFHGVMLSLTSDGLTLTPVCLAEVRDFVDVNAIPSDCTLSFHHSLTLVYGSNGSGKSGIARLLANACFCRGKRDILPDLRKPSQAPSNPSATFVLSSKDGTPQAPIKYARGTHHHELKRFAVFDTKSVPLHLDESNTVSFTPGHIQVFDRVADAIKALERRLDEERQRRRCENPFASLFIDLNEKSTVATLCRALSSKTADQDLLQYATYTPESDDSRAQLIEHEIAEKRGLDIVARRALLLSEERELLNLCTTLEDLEGQVSSSSAEAINENRKSIEAQTKDLAAIGARTFDDGLVLTTGSPEWRAFLVAAKDLFQKEKTMRSGVEPDHCLLCRQTMQELQNDLFHRYWRFLESNAEVELTKRTAQRSVQLDTLRRARARMPVLDDALVAVRVLRSKAPDLIGRLNESVAAIGTALDEWIRRCEATEIVNSSLATRLDIGAVRAVAAAKRVEAEGLVDPATEIAQLHSSLLELRHRKAVTELQSRGLEYLSYLRWYAKSEGVNFASLKMTTTKQRRDIFLADVATTYKSELNANLKQLGSDADLVMWTSGDQGTTVKEFKLEFSEEHTPTEILSEGEQNVCAIADFLTEVTLDPRNCGVILDDPVTSLDHARKAKIAKRLVEEGMRRQVVVFTHDISFLSKLVRAAGGQKVPYACHWIRSVNGVPGTLEANASPRLAHLGKLKEDAKVAVKNLENLVASEQERSLERGFDYLRSACEALIEEKLFAGVVERYEDQIRVHNLEDAVFDLGLALRVVELHERLSEFLPGHNRSDLMREQPPTLQDFRDLLGQLEALEMDLKNASRAAKQARQARKTNEPW